MSKPASYRRSSLIAKQAYALNAQRPPPMRCPWCMAAITVADFLAHVDERCPGRGIPHRLSRWVSMREAESFGLPRGTLHRWGCTGLVRVRTVDGRVTYLLRDIVWELVIRRGPK